MLLPSILVAFSTIRVSSPFVRTLQIGAALNILCGIWDYILSKNGEQIEKKSLTTTYQYFPLTNTFNPLVKS